LTAGFGSFGAIYDTAESMDAYAVYVDKVVRAIQRWDKKHGFYKLNPGDPQDARDYEKYKTLTRELRNLEGREERAARHHDFEELVRLTNLAAGVRDKRTRITAQMGLRHCGA
jgi:hypothetical protein